MFEPRSRTLWLSKLNAMTKINTLLKILYETKNANFPTKYLILRETHLCNLRSGMRLRPYYPHIKHDTGQKLTEPETSLFAFHWLSFWTYHTYWSQRCSWFIFKKYLYFRTAVIVLFILRYDRKKCENKNRRQTLFLNGYLNT